MRAKHFVRTMRPMGQECDGLEADADDADDAGCVKIQYA